MVKMSLDLTETKTGEYQSRMLFTVTMLDNYPVEMGSYLKLFIPADFKVPDPERVAASCQIVSGFSDEVTCDFESLDPRTGHYLFIRNGFDSADFDSGVFSFALAEV